MLRRPTSIKLMELFGFRIGVDRSWFLILFLMIFWLSGYFRQALHSSDGVAYLTTVVTVLVLFGSTRLPKLARSLGMTRRRTTRPEATRLVSAAKIAASRPRARAAGSMCTTFCNSMTARAPRSRSIAGTAASCRQSSTTDVSIHRAAVCRASLSSTYFSRRDSARGRPSALIPR